MNDKTGFISGDELLASLRATPEELASAMEWMRARFSFGPLVGKEERQASMLAAGMTVAP